MNNSEISDLFSYYSKLLDLHGEDAFKAKSYSISAYNIDQIQTSISELSLDALASMKGIGQNTANKIKEIISSGKFQPLDEILAKTPNGVLEMMQIKGLGPKKIRVIWKEMGIESIGELEYACHENRLANFKGFGTKTQESILQNIRFIKDSEGFQLWAEVENTANTWIQKLTQAFPKNQFLLTGDFYQQIPIISSIQIVTDLPQHTLLNLWSKAPGIEITTVDQVSTIKLHGQLPIEFHFVEAKKTAAHQFQYACSPSFFQTFSERFTVVESFSEKEIFEKNNLQYIHPALRWDAKYINLSEQNQLPQLIEKGDIKGLIHAHSTWSDGQNALIEMAEHAINKGFEYMLITDHSQSAFYANGLKPESIFKQHLEIDQLNVNFKNFKIYKGIESDILNDGSLDYSNNILDQFDLIIASVHSNLKMTEDKATQRILTAIQNPYTSILGHLTGRLLLSRAGYPIDHKTIIDACSHYNVAIEINAHPKRLDLDWEWIAYAIDKGVLLSINPDAHSLNGMDDIYYGCIVAQKGGLTKQHNISSFNRTELENFIQTQKLKRNLQSL
jgi:DNA polymerase (family 10)